MQNNTFHLVSLGCDKNKVDSEIIMGLLCDAGYVFAPDASEAEVLIVNTCGFIRDAVKESIETVLTLAEHKKSDSGKKLLVTGCMAERYREQIKEEIPEADAVLGVNEYHRLAEVLNGIQDQKDQPDLVSKTSEALYARRAPLSYPHTAYVKIAEGCDNCCAYCTIPGIRGPYRSRPYENIVDECRRLAGQGAREITLVAQDTARYGYDLYGRPRLHELLREIAKIDLLRWVRVMYAYPEHITPELIAALASHPKICRYIDMPIQHSHDGVLARMGRRGTHAGLRAVIHALREKVPGIILRTTLMVGFPGETDEEFDALRQFISEVRFDRLGVFMYSREDGTAAARMKPQVKASVKQARRDALMRLQQDIHGEKARALVGQITEVLIDEMESPGVYVGRSYRDAFETDTVVTVHSKKPFQPGDMVDVLITGANEYDLYGVPQNESAE